MHHLHLNEAQIPERPAERTKHLVSSGESIAKNGKSRLSERQQKHQRLGVGVSDTAQMKSCAIASKASSEAAGGDEPGAIDEIQAIRAGQRRNENAEVAGGKAGRVAHTVSEAYAALGRNMPLPGTLHCAGGLKERGSGCISKCSSGYASCGVHVVGIESIGCGVCRHWLGMSALYFFWTSPNRLGRKTIYIVLKLLLAQRNSNADK